MKEVALKMLTVSEAAERLRYAKETIRRMIAEGRLKAQKLPSGRLRIAESDVQGMLSPVKSQKGA